MTAGQGYNTHFLLKREASYGVDPGGNYLKGYVNGHDLGKTRGLISDPLAGQGRDPLAQHPDVIDVGGGIKVPVDPRYIGYLLTGLLGDPSTSGSGTYTHVFKSGGLTLPSYAFEVAHKGPATFELLLGNMINSISFTGKTGGGPAEASVNVIGQSCTPNGSTQGGTPTTKTLSRFSNFQGAITTGGSPLAAINSVDFTYSNNLVPVRVVNDTGNISGIELGQASITGRLSTRFASTTLRDLAIAGTALDITLIYTISSSLKLTLAINEAYLETPKASIDGPGGYGLDFNFAAVYNTSATAMLTATLINDQAGTVYTT